MNQQYFLLHRDEVEKANYERMKAFQAVEARWPKWIKRSSLAVWGVCIIAGFIWARAMGALIGFVIGGVVSSVYEKITRKIVGKKLGIREISYKEAVKDIVERQNREFREKEAAMIAEENARIEAEYAAKQGAVDAAAETVPAEAVQAAEEPAVTEEV